MDDQSQVETLFTKLERESATTLSSHPSIQAHHDVTESRLASIENLLKLICNEVELLINERQVSNK